MPPRMVLALLLAVMPLAHARADEDDDQERARSGREAGRALPLASILDRVRQSTPGVVLGVELEDEGGRVLYEVKVLRPDGRVRLLAYDAATGKRVAHREADEDGGCAGSSSRTTPSWAASSRSSSAARATPSTAPWTARRASSWAPPSPTTRSCSTSACRAWTGSRSCAAGAPPATRCRS